MDHAPPPVGPFFLNDLRKPVGLFLFVAVGVLGAVLIVLTSAGSSLRGPAAGAALRMGAFDAEAKASLADLLAKAQLAAHLRGQQTRTAEPTRLARAALARDPLLSDAWWVLAAASQIDNEPASQARAFLDMSMKVSRRNVPTNVMLAEAFVQRNDSRNAFRQLDLALRRSAAGRTALLPIMAKGVADPVFQRLLLQSLKTDHGWRADFLTNLGSAPLDDATLARFLAALPREAVAQTRAQLFLLAGQLLQKGSYLSARELGVRLGMPNDGFVNPGFENVATTPPFNWATQTGPDYDAVVAAYGGAIEGKRALYLRSSTPRDVEVARHVVFLDPGSYRMSAVAGSIESPLNRITLALVCGGADGALGKNLASLAFIAPPARQAATIDATVPATDCAAQWLLVMIQAPAGGSEASGWLDRVAIKKIRGHVVN